MGLAAPRNPSHPPPKARCVLKKIFYLSFIKIYILFLLLDFQIIITFCLYECIWWFFCAGQCPPLESDSVFATCQFGLTQVNCSKPMLPGTTATYQCKPSHKEYSSLTEAGVYKRILTCKPDGHWSHPLYECIPGMEIFTNYNLSPQYLQRIWFPSLKLLLEHHSRVFPSN